MGSSLVCSTSSMRRERLPRATQRRGAWNGWNGQPPSQLYALANWQSAFSKHRQNKAIRGLRDGTAADQFPTLIDLYEAASNPLLQIWNY